MIEYLAELFGVDSPIVQIVPDLIYGVLLFFAFKRKKKGSVDIVKDDLDSLIEYHKKALDKLEKLKKENKEV